MAALPSPAELLAFAEDLADSARPWPCATSAPPSMSSRRRMRARSRRPTGPSKPSSGRASRPASRPRHPRRGDGPEARRRAGLGHRPHRRHQELRDRPAAVRHPDRPHRRRAPGRRRHRHAGAGRALDRPTRTGPVRRRPRPASGCRTLAEARFFTTTPMASRGRTRRATAASCEPGRHPPLLRRLLWFPTGCWPRAIAISSPRPGPAYDYLALVPVIEAAGGIVTDWDGAALTLGSDCRVLAAATPALHGAALAILRDRDI